MSFCRVDRKIGVCPHGFRFKEFAALLFLGAIVGCGGGESLYPVEGNLAVDGTPLAKGPVTLWPEGAASHGEPPAGEVQNGKFKVFTKGRAGAPEGKYKVTVSANEEVDSTK